MAQEPQTRRWHLTSRPRRRHRQRRRAHALVPRRRAAQWRALPSSKGRYIDVGLWRYSRHPNYFGEWLLWCGQFVLCSSAFTDGDSQGAFDGAGWLSAISPAFVFVLLNFVSGVPMLEKGSDERWGREQAYQAYKRETWVFFLLPTCRTAASRPQVVSELSSAAGLG